jgi:hypothetical protein
MDLDRDRSLGHMRLAEVALYGAYGGLLWLAGIAMFANVQLKRADGTAY